MKILNLVIVCWVFDVVVVYLCSQEIRIIT
nr:MAG TPA: hypothetical protein [Caudoviricetes sp.]DAR42570.1 MAG TPA: hypothetical protein [Caudoviricetes sp.]DAS71860.1 MAG TPA: hypothetical protein [Caudoviricetes sp.]